MKTQILLTLGAVVLTAATFNLTAGDALLSPRAASSQARVVAGSDRNLAAEKNVGGTSLSPRAAGNQTVRGAGMETIMVKCPVSGSPRSATALGSAARMSCCSSTLAECSTMDQMK